MVNLKCNAYQIFIHVNSRAPATALSFNHYSSSLLFCSTSLQSNGKNCSR